MRKKSITLAILLLAAVVAVTMFGCRKRAKDGSLGLKAGQEAASNSQSSSPSGTTGSAGLKSSATLTLTAGSEGVGGIGAVPDDPSESTDPSGSGSSSGDGDSTTPPKKDGMTVKILWWNDSKSKPPACEVVFGGDAFKPSATKDAAEGSIGPVAYDKDTQLVIYPDGRDGRKIIVPFKVDHSMISNSERDAIHVEVSDARVRVLGNPVDGFDLSFDRF